MRGLKRLKGSEVSRWKVVLVVSLGLMLAGAAGSARGQGPPGGRGAAGRPGRGPDAALRADQQVFHYLLDNHQQIQRTVELTEHGVETSTTSEQPEVAAKIQQHVAAMQRRVESGRGLRYWDPLFAAIFRRHAAIQMKVEKTPQGVKVVETSDDPVAVRLIQAHAQVVSLFVKHGFAEAHRSHNVPADPQLPKSESPPADPAEKGGLSGGSVPVQ
ncbi:MAG: hypothetical protein U0795_20495 [Pirellulales bacterium]